MRRLTLTLFLAILLSIFSLGFLFDALFEGDPESVRDEYSELLLFGGALASALDSSSEQEKFQSQWPNDQEYDVSISTLEDLPLPPDLQSTFQSGEPIALESEDGISFHFQLLNSKKVLTIQTQKRSKHDVALVFTSLFYMGTLVLVFLWLKPLLDRLKLLKTTTAEFGSGQLTSRVKPSYFSYISDIEHDFNSMADQIQQLIDDNKLLTAAVSHDLRTPLARLRFGIDTLAESETSSQHARYIERMSTDIEKMEQQVTALLRYARLDNVLAGTNMQTVSLRQLLGECVGSWQDIAVNISVVEIGLTTDEPLNISGCIEHLATMINNLIENAIKHADTLLIVELDRNPNAVALVFRDNGPGIDEALRTHVLKPFQRGDDSANSGYGLGLAVVNRIANHHGAIVSIDNCEQLGGAKITVTFTVDTTS